LLWREKKCITETNHIYDLFLLLFYLKLENKIKN
jgi:hypothetical protein